MCIWLKKKINSSRPKVSDASQFHQPPQELSCKAHQLPKNKEKKFEKKRIYKKLIIEIKLDSLKKVKDLKFKKLL